MRATSHVGSPRRRVLRPLRVKSVGMVALCLACSTDRPLSYANQECVSAAHFTLRRLTSSLPSCVMGDTHTRDRPMHEQSIARLRRQIASILMLKQALLWLA